MKEFSDQLYISDLDGTLLQRDARLSEFARRALTELLNRSFPFTVATARSVTSTREILGNLPFRVPVICANGGAIYHYESREAVHIEYMDRQVLARVLGDMDARRSTAFVSAVVDGREKVFYDALPNGGMEWYHADRVAASDDRLTRIPTLLACRDLPVTTITFMDGPYQIKGLRKFFTKQYGGDLRLNHFENKYSPGWYWLSLHAPGSNKAAAIDKVLAVNGWAGRRLTVFGDEWNDLPMFERADHAVATANALPSVKAAAHEVIGENTEDAVVHYLLQKAGITVEE